MPKPKDNRVFLEHMLHYVGVAKRLHQAPERGEEQELALQRCLEIIGEAARNVSDELKAKYADVAWRDAIDTRNIVIHGYFGISMKTLWDIVEDDLPELEKQIQLILDEMK